MRIQPEEGYATALVNKTEVSFDFMDRIRILFGFRALVTVVISVETDPGQTTSKADTLLERPAWMPKPKAQQAEPEGSR